jgi:hypothetical protein
MAITDIGVVSSKGRELTADVKQSVPKLESELATAEQMRQKSALAMEQSEEEAEREAERHEREKKEWSQADEDRARKAEAERDQAEMDSYSAYLEAYDLTGDSEVANKVYAMGSPEYKEKAAKLAQMDDQIVSFTQQREAQYAELMEPLVSKMTGIERDIQKLETQSQVPGNMQVLDQLNAERETLTGQIGSIEEENTRAVQAMQELQTQREALAGSLFPEISFDAAANRITLNTPEGISVSGDKDRAGTWWDEKPADIGDDKSLNKWFSRAADLGLDVTIEGLSITDQIALKKASGEYGVSESDLTDMVRYDPQLAANLAQIKDLSAQVTSMEDPLTGEPLRNTDPATYNSIKRELGRIKQENQDRIDHLKKYGYGSAPAAAPETPVSALRETAPVIGPTREEEAAQVPRIQEEILTMIQQNLNNNPGAVLEMIDSEELQATINEMPEAERQDFINKIQQLRAQALEFLQVQKTAEAAQPGAEWARIQAGKPAPINALTGMIPDIDIPLPEVSPERAAEFEAAMRGRAPGLPERVRP